MSFTIDEAFVRQYTDNVYMLSQQMGSRLSNAVTQVPNIVGKQIGFERLAEVTVEQMTTRHGDTPLISSTHSKRWMSLLDYHWADLIDDMDTIKMLIDPTSDYAIAAASAMGRQKDTRIITAFDATVVTDEDQGGTAAFPSGYIVAVDFADNATSPDSNLTLGKLRRAKTLLDLQDTPEEERYFVYGPEQLNALLRDTTLTSLDYNDVRALIDGRITRYLGFEFIMTNLLTIDASNIRECYAFQKRGMKLGMGKDIVGRISERGDKNYSKQVYYSMSLNSVRMDETSVVQVLCDEDL